MGIDVRGLAAKDADLAARVVAWKGSCESRARKGIEDAVAHASRSLTRAALKASPGEDTLSAIRNGRSYGAAQERVRETCRDLGRAVGDAREDFYRAAFAGWRRCVDPRWLRGVQSPEAVRVRRIREVPVHGIPLGEEVRVAAQGAGDQLLQAIAMASTPGVTEDPEGVLEAWGVRATGALVAASVRLLDDSWVIADRAAGRDVMKPQFLHPDPLLD